MGPSFVTLLTLALPLVGAAPSNFQRRADSCSVRGYDKGRPEAYFWSQSTKYCRGLDLMARAISLL